MPNKIFRNTHVPEFEATLDELAGREPRTRKKLYGPDPDFPGKPTRFGLLSSSQPAASRSPARRLAIIHAPCKTVVDVEGLGWSSSNNISALLASGNAVDGYEKNMHKLYRGQIGTTGFDEDFSVGNACAHVLVQPKFTPSQLDQLPAVSREISELELYAAIVEKQKAISEFFHDTSIPFPERKQRYAKLGPVKRGDVIATKSEVMEHLSKTDNVNVLEQEYTADMAEAARLSGRAIFLAHGEQLNKSKMGLENIEDHPRVVFEMSFGAPKTDQLISWLKEQQVELSAKYGSKKPPKEALPTITVIGGGPIAKQNILDVLARVNPELLNLIWIHPKQKLLTNVKAPSTEVKFTAACKTMKLHDTRIGYASDIELSADKKLIKSVDFTDESGKVSKIAADMFIHIEDIFERAGEINNSRIPIGKLIADKIATSNPENALIRLSANFALEEGSKIPFYLEPSEEASFSMSRDSRLISLINSTIKLQEQGRETTIVVSSKAGGNFASWLTVLAASRGYRGNFVDVRLADESAGEVRDEHIDFDLQLKKFGSCKEIIGRLEQGEIDDTGSLTLYCRDSDGLFTSFPTDGLVGGGGKTRRTELVEALVECDKIGEHEPQSSQDSGLHSQDEWLNGQKDLFFAERDSDNDSISTQDFVLNCLPGVGDSRSEEPADWHRVFEWGLDYREARLVESGELPPADVTPEEPARKSFGLTAISRTSGKGKAAASVALSRAPAPAQFGTQQGQASTRLTDAQKRTP